MWLILVQLYKGSNLISNTCLKCETPFYFLIFFLYLYFSTYEYFQNVGTQHRKLLLLRWFFSKTLWNWYLWHFFRESRNIISILYIVWFHLKPNTKRTKRNDSCEIMREKTLQILFTFCESLAFHFLVF